MVAGQSCCAFFSNLKNLIVEQFQANSPHVVKLTLDFFVPLGSLLAHLDKLFCIQTPASGLKMGEVPKNGLTKLLNL